MKIRTLCFRKHGFQFEKLVELYEQIEHLKIYTEEFQNIRQNLMRQKLLKKVEIFCNYPVINPKNLKLVSSENQSVEEEIFEGSAA